MQPVAIKRRLWCPKLHELEVYCSVLVVRRQHGRALQAAMMKAHFTH